MEASNISAEMQQEIQDKTNGFRAAMFGHPHATELTMAYVDGIGEYASKLHLLQQEYDKLKGENERLANAFNVAETGYKAAKASYNALKEKADKMAIAIETALAPRNRSIPGGYISEQSIHWLGTALSSYNSNTNNSDVYIGNPKEYCRECGFPVDECNCELNTKS